jgi:hypothetical protein
MMEKSTPSIASSLQSIFSRKPKKKKWVDDEGIEHTEMDGVVVSKRTKESTRKHSGRSGLRYRHKDVSWQKIKARPTVVSNTRDFGTDENPDTIARELSSQSIFRVSPFKLEEMFYSDPIAQSGAGYYRDILYEILKPSMLRCSSECRKALWDDLISTFNWQRSLGMEITHSFIYGNALVVPTPSFSDCQTFYVADWRMFDYIKDGGKVRTLNGIVPYGFKFSQYDLSIDKELQQKEYVYDKDVYHIALNQIHYTEPGWGYVELMYDQIQQRINLADGRNNRTRREGVGVPIAFYGTDRYPPSPKLKNQALQIRDDVDDPYTVAMTCPSTIRLSSLDDELGYAKANDSIMTEDYLNSLSAGVMAIPLAALVMTSDKKDAARMLDTLLPFMEWRIKSLGRQLRLEDQFTLWANRHGFNESVRIHWGDVLPQSIKEASMRLFRILKTEQVPLPEHPVVKEYISQVIGMPEDILEIIRDSDVTVPPPTSTNEPPGEEE